MEKKDLIFEAVRERDIDFLFLEEWNVNAAFVGWFFEKLFNTSEKVNNSKGWHSTHDHGNGETDLRFEVETEKGKYLILVENKIDAEAQEQQGYRYLVRADSYQGQSFKAIATCIIAPENYLQHNSEVSEYMHTLSYEEIRDFFIGYQESRMQYKANLLQAAINQERRGYRAVKDVVVTDFMLQYWHLLSNKYKHITMKKPNNVPKRSDWPQLKMEWFPYEWHIKHKLSNGTIDLQTTLTETDVTTIQKVLNEKGYHIVKTGKSFTIRKMVHPIDKESRFEEQRSIIEDALRIIDAFSELKEILPLVGK